MKFVYREIGVDNGADNDCKYDHWCGRRWAPGPCDGIALYEINNLGKSSTLKEFTESNINSKIRMRGSLVRKLGNSLR